ncbi:MAG: hypothetical protein K0Q79_180 [Flavipsychrobacter sp.]|jgi:tetratricopeptide (TPR) repeat protein|nr:hypothetical protein [Flavipsychrobacter sp.]
MFLCILCVFSTQIHAQKKQGQPFVDSLLKELHAQKDETVKINIFIALARAYYRIDPKEGMKYGELGLNLSTRLGDKQGIARSYCVLGGLYDLRGNIAEGRKYDSIALQMLQQHGDKHWAALSYYFTGKSLQLNDHTASLSALLTALKMFEEEGSDASRDGIIDCHIAIGAAYGSTGDYLKGLEHLKAATKMCLDANDKLRLASCYTNTGIIFYYLANYPEALNNHFAALKINEEAGAKMKMANCYNNIGMVYTEQGNKKEALKSTTAALSFYEEFGNKQAIAVTLQNIASINYLLDNDSAALRNYRRALSIYEELDDKNGIADCYAGFGNIYSDEKNFQQAIKYLLAALGMFEKTDNRYSVAKSLFNIANVYHKQNLYSDADKYAARSLDEAEKISAIEIISEASELLSQVNAATGNYKKSLTYYKSFVASRDSMFGEAQTKKAAQVQMQYEFDKREALARVEQDKKDAILLSRLERKNIVIYCSTAAFILLLAIVALYIRQGRLRISQQKAELEQKQLRAQMNPHFIFNCLNSIQHFVVANDVKNANKYLSGFALLMRQTLENSKDGIITLRKEIAYLENYLSLELLRFEDKFTVEITCADDVNADAIEVPAMIIQPFIENAIRHGLCYLEDRLGVLKIQFYKKEGCLYCEVDDNGIGMERSRMLKERNQIAYESHGMELTRKRLALVSKGYGSDYSIEVVNKKNNNGEPEGTIIIIKFPLEK